jgi:uncharacterized membrane protein YraQ (UPF0718 family)
MALLRFRAPFWRFVPARYCRLFAGIWKRGAGLGPAIAFLYSGPAINVLAIVLTARILGPEIGLARAVGAVVFSVVIGLIMHLLFRKEEQAKAEAALHMPEQEVERPLWQNVVYFAVMVGILVSATWGKPTEPAGLWHAIYSVKWLVTGFFAIVFGVLLVKWFRVKAYKVLLAAAAVLTLAIIFPHEPLIAFSAGIIALVVLTTTTRGETESPGFCPPGILPSRLCRFCLPACWWQACCWDVPVPKA